MNEIEKIDRFVTIDPFLWACIICVSIVVLVYYGFLFYEYFHRRARRNRLRKLRCCATCIHRPLKYDQVPCDQCRLSVPPGKYFCWSPRNPEMYTLLGGWPSEFACVGGHHIASYYYNPAIHGEKAELPVVYYDGEPVDIEFESLSKCYVSEVLDGYTRAETPKVFRGISPGDSETSSESDSEES